MPIYHIDTSPYQAIFHDNDPILSGLGNLSAALINAPVQRAQLEQGRADKAAELALRGRSLDLESGRAADARTHSAAELALSGRRADAADADSAETTRHHHALEATAAQVAAARQKALGADGKPTRQREFEPYTDNYKVDEFGIPHKAGKRLLNQDEIQNELQVRLRFRKAMEAAGLAAPGTAEPTAADVGDAGEDGDDEEGMPAAAPGAPAAPAALPGAGRAPVASAGELDPGVASLVSKVLGRRESTIAAEPRTMGLDQIAQIGKGGPATTPAQSLVKTLGSEPMVGNRSVVPDLVGGDTPARAQAIRAIAKQDPDEARRIIAALKQLGHD